MKKPPTHCPHGKPERGRTLDAPQPSYVTYSDGCKWKRKKPLSDFVADPEHGGIFLPRKEPKRKRRLTTHGWCKMS